MELPEFDNDKIQQMECALLGLHIKDELDGAQQTRGSLLAKLAKLEFQLNKMEAMLGFLLAKQQTELLRSPRPGEVVYGNPQNTKIKYFRSGLEEFLGGPWKKQLERNLAQYQAPVAEGGVDEKAHEETVLQQDVQEAPAHEQPAAPGPGLDDQSQREGVEGPDQSPS